MQKAVAGTVGPDNLGVFSGDTVQAMSKGSLWDSVHNNLERAQGKLGKLAREVSEVFSCCMLAGDL